MPELRLSTDKYDFGFVKSDSIYEGFVIIKNIGKDSLIIRDIQADCGCTRTFVSKNVLLSGDTCLLNFSFKTYNKKGYQTNYIYIETNTDKMVDLLSINSIID